MVETPPTFLSALDGVASSGRYGIAGGAPGVIAHEITGIGLAHVAARNGQRAVLAEAARSAFSIELPNAPRRTGGNEIAFIWAGPNQWLVAMASPPTVGLDAVLAAALGRHAAIVEQSHARTLLRISGPRVRDALAKGLALDLHPRAFTPGHAAMTTVAHIAVHLWQLDDTPTYEIAVPRSNTSSFWHWLEASAAEYGLQLERASVSA